MGISAHTIGAKYIETKDLDIKDVAKLIRADLKDKWPAGKFSVQLQRYSMGQSLHIEASTQVVMHGAEDSDGYWNEHKLNKEGVEWQRQIREVADAYNYDDSDSMSDYHDVRFYAHIRITRP